MVNQKLKLSAADSYWFAIDSHWFANMQIVRINVNHVNPCVNPCVNCDSHIVGKKRFSALKW